MGWLGSGMFTVVATEEELRDIFKALKIYIEILEVHELMKS